MLEAVAERLLLWQPDLTPGPADSLLSRPLFVAKEVGLVFESLESMCSSDAFDMSGIYQSKRGE